VIDGLAESDTLWLSANRVDVSPELRSLRSDLLHQFVNGFDDALFDRRRERAIVTTRTKLNSKALRRRHMAGLPTRGLRRLGTGPP
jgi:hypothetical protein